MTTLKLLIASLMVSLPFAVSAKEVSVTVKGMVCGFCAQGLKRNSKLFLRLLRWTLVWKRKSSRLAPKRIKMLAMRRLTKFSKTLGITSRKSKEVKNYDGDTEEFSTSNFPVTFHFLWNVSVLRNSCLASFTWNGCCVSWSCFRLSSACLVVRTQRLDLCSVGSLVDPLGYCTF